MDSVPQILIALIGALGGATLLGIATEYLRQGGRRLDDVSAFRRELLDRVREMERQVATQAKEIDDWQQRYYALRGENESLKGQIGALLSRLAHYEIVPAAVATALAKNGNAQPPVVADGGGAGPKDTA